MSLKEESVFVPESEQIDVSAIELDAIERKVETNIETNIETKVEEFFEEVIVGVELNDIDKINDKSLVNTFLDIIKTYDEKNTDPTNYFNKIGFKINNDILDLTQKIINKTPTLLNEIEIVVLEVTKDNKIDSNDIPKFMLIVQILYERIFNQKDFPLDITKRSEFCSMILKFIIHTLVEERKILINDEKKNEFLSQLDKLIESCMSLISFSHILEQPKICCTIM